MKPSSIECEKPIYVILVWSEVEQTVGSSTYYTTLLAQVKIVRQKGKTVALLLVAPNEFSIVLFCSCSISHSRRNCSRRRVWLPLGLCRHQSISLKKRATDVWAIEKRKQVYTWCTNEVLDKANITSRVLGKRIECSTQRSRLTRPTRQCFILDFDIIHHIGRSYTPRNKWSCKQVFSKVHQPG